MKQLLTILAVLIVLSGVGIAVYFLFFAHSAPHLEVGNGSSFNNAVSNATTTTTDQGTTVVKGSAGTLVAPGLVEISKDAVAAGVAVFNTNASTSDIAVHYIDRASGNIYEYTVFGRSLARIGNKTLPGIQIASWLKDGSTAFAQFVTTVGEQEHINTYALPVSGSGYFLQQDLAQATVFGSSTVFTLNNSGNSSVGTIARADGSNSHTLFTNPLTSLVVFPSGNDFIAVPKAANSLDGYAFAINSAGTFTPILGPLKGLTVLPSPSGKQLLFSYIDKGTVTMAVFDRTTGGVTKLPLATMAEKCAWSSDNNSLYCAIPTSLSGILPDNWYQGATSFTDRIWRIDLLSRNATLVLDPESAKVTVDAVNLTLDPNAHVLVFRNKIDSSLWAYNL